MYFDIYVPERKGASVQTKPKVVNHRDLHYLYLSLVYHQPQYETASPKVLPGRESMRERKGIYRVSLMVLMFISHSTFTVFCISLSHPPCPSLYPPNNAI